MKQNTNKVGFKEKVQTYYSYNKYKLPIIFTLIGMFFLTAFPGAHYEHWFRVDAKYNAVAIFAIMLLALVQVVNSISLSAKESRKQELTFTILFTVINIAIIFLAIVYIAPYFKNGYDARYLKTTLIISLGIVFMLIANVFAFVFFGYDIKAAVNQVIKQLEEEKNFNNE